MHNTVRSGGSRPPSIAIADGEPAASVIDRLSTLERIFGEYYERNEKEKAELIGRVNQLEHVLGTDRIPTKVNSY